ncbi:glycosyltransferase family 4 protein [Pseudoalteromonas ruthenica]|uniref:glycosyltransferase family 4 protein n=1 Tax=Pseudoalteromonas ruthenica TaxID=151081 RepID=UPI00241D4E00|nr:glycosyltransferase family 4 protein [Pseudoalteromonas ruthenica]
MQTNDMHICHLTSVHNRSDTRVYLKMCESLKSAGYKVSLVVADGQGDETKDGVNIFDVGTASSRFSRILKMPKEVAVKGLELNAHVYHMHDPELLTVANLLKKNGKKVIFDAHEDFPKQLLSKPYLSKPVAKILSFAADSYEKYKVPKLDGIIAATPVIRDKFKNMNSNVIDINNYPILGELKRSGNVERESYFAYVGAFSKIRGIVELAQALSINTSLTLKVAGKCQEQETLRQVNESLGAGNIEFLGSVDRKGVQLLLEKAIAGLVTFLPEPNHVEAQPNKLFEYMSAGLPVIASNFPLWRNVVEKHECGICVDPTDPQQIADAMQFLVDNPEKAKQMGKNGVAAVESKYSWQPEFAKLKAFYEKVSQ